MKPSAKAKPALTTFAVVATRKDGTRTVETVEVPVAPPVFRRKPPTSMAELRKLMKAS